MSPATFGLILTALTALGGFLGVVLSGVGKRGDQKAQGTNDAFKRLTEELSYWHGATTEAREALARCLGGTSSELPPEPLSGPPPQA